MDPVALLLGGMYIAFGIFLIAICIPLKNRKVGMNGAYGVRIPKSFESEENWYELNAYFGKRTVWWGAAMVLFAAASTLLPFWDDTTFIMLFSFSPLLFIMVPVVQTLLYARRLP